MAFQKMKWIDVPDPNNMPTLDDIVDRPEYQNTIPAFDAENMNRIEDGIEECIQGIEDVKIYVDNNIILLKSKMFPKTGIYSMLIENFDPEKYYVLVYYNSGSASHWIPYAYGTRQACGALSNYITIESNGEIKIEIGSDGYRYNSPVLFLPVKQIC